MIIDIHQVRQLIQKYNVSAPRYTSYPTAPQFRPVEDPRLLQQTVQTERRREPANYSIYFHLPFLQVALLVLRLPESDHPPARSSGSLPELPGEGDCHDKSRPA